MAESVSVRVPEEDVAQITTISHYMKKGKSEVLREVLELGIKEKKLEIALDKYRMNKATAWKAAQIAGVSLSEFLDLLTKRRIDFHYGIKELQEDFEGFV